MRQNVGACAAKKIEANGTPVQTVKLSGLNGVVGMLQAKDQIQAFVDK